MTKLFDEVRARQYIENLQKVTIEDVRRVLSRMLAKPFALKVSVTDAEDIDTIKAQANKESQRLFGFTIFN